MSSDEESEEIDGFWGEDGQWHERRDIQHTKEDHIYGIFNTQNTSYRRNNTRQRRRTAALPPESLSLRLLRLHRHIS